MTARLELFLLCFVLPVAGAILLAAFQDRRRERERRANAMREHLRQVIEGRY